jgi:ATP-dependent DNA ligase
MPEHMDVDWKGKADARADALDVPVHGISRERPVALGREDEGQVRELPAQLAPGSHLVATERVRARLAVLGAAVGPNWLHEIKHGFRILAPRDAGGVRLYTRNGNDFTERFPLVVAAIAVLPAPLA